MKIIKVAFVTVGLLVSLYIAFLLLWPGDVVTNDYADMTEARAAQLFERGWLPDILPASAHEIRTTNNLDLNESEGEFTLNPADLPAFNAKTKPYSSRQTKGAERLGRYAEKKRDKGFAVTTYDEANVTWIFSCKPESGHCEYFMWLQRG